MPRIQIPESYITTLSKQEQILQLNNEVRCRIAPSDLHGVGVVAMRDIQKGERCYITPRVTPVFYTLSFSDLNKLKEEIKALVMDRWASVVNGSIFQSPNDDAKLLMFVNHSDDPNYDVKSDLALKDIKKGEEVTENYCFMENANKVYPNLCK